MPNSDFFDERDLLARLTTGLRKDHASVIFLIGSPISAPIGANGKGVPGVSGIIQLIRDEFSDSADEEKELIGILQSPNVHPYQEAFRFLIGRRGQRAANDIIRRSVWLARKDVAGSGSTYSATETTSDDVCRTAEKDIEGWELSPGLEAIGQLIANYPDQFGEAMLTTNFDPLLEVAIERAGSPYYRTTLDGDGNLSQTVGTGCHVIHLHGYWHGSDTLHTGRQLSQPRPRLKASLASLIKGKTLVVSGYGGWDDTCTDALMSIVLDDSATPDIVWTCKESPPNLSASLATKLSRGADRGRVNFYAGIDCHSFFPKLYGEWSATATPAIVTSPLKSNRLPAAIKIVPVPNVTSEQRNPETINKVLEGDDEDRPPLIDFFVDRKPELDELLSCKDRVCFITGLGGQGKSALAAKYFSDAQLLSRFDLFVWRDCKEEAERLETHLVGIIEKLTKGAVKAPTIANLPIEVLVELLIKHTDHRRVLFVFDNIDHYVDLENDRLNESSNRFIEAWQHSGTLSQVVFTCRPSISYPDQQIYSRKLQGLTLKATAELFEKRGANCALSEIEEAHTFTEGHAFWLDLLAAQVARKDLGHNLPDLLRGTATGRAALPDETLQSIWNTLPDREQVVLRALAESVRPESEYRLGEFLSSRMRFNRFRKALKYLRSLGLIVVKPRLATSDVVELHPLVRQFIRRRFPMVERVSFIKDIINVYARLIGQYEHELTQRPKLTILQTWTEIAELALEAGQYEEAFNQLAKVGTHFDGSGYSNEYIRVSSQLLAKVDWSQHTQYKEFDEVFERYAHMLIAFGRFSSAEHALASFENTIQSKDARFILLCDLRCYNAWLQRDFSAAIEWGKRGKDLKEKTNVDTKHDTSHNLALAQRDGGQVDEALKYFLENRNLQEVIDPEELDEEADGAYYGNIGRCLQLMGQIDPALNCYRKSAFLIERDSTIEHVLNQGYARRWIGELLLARGEWCVAKIFLEAARCKWQEVSPHLAGETADILTNIKQQTKDCTTLSECDLERYCIAWIYGRENEFRRSDEYC